jgi:hypothetical protein
MVTGTGAKSGIVDLLLAARDELAPAEELIPRVEGGERVRVLQLRKGPDRPWLGSLRQYAERVDDHTMEGIRESIKKGRLSEE